MKFVYWLAIAVVLFAPGLSQAAVSCPARTPAAITTVAAASVKCQKTIAKQGEKFLKTKMKVMAKCLLKQGTAAACPDAAGVAKIEQTADKVAEKIAKQCATDSVQNGLSTSYAALNDDAVITSCMLSQHNATGLINALRVTGQSTETTALLSEENNDLRTLCIKELSKSGRKYVEKALKNANKCLGKQMKDETAGNLAPVCVGEYNGSFTAPSDTKTAEKQSDLVTQIEAKIDDKCGALASVPDGIASLFACPGATTVQDLKECILCGGWDVVLDVLAQQHSESGTFVAHGAGALQAAVTVATSGDRLLIEPGDYQEEVTIGAGRNNLAVVGCGGAKDDRPRIIPPVTQVSGRGFQATGVDGLLFQSLDFFNQSNDHIRVVQAEGVTFRDITGDGNRNTAYAVFPQFSNNVLVEGLRVHAQDDAPIYVGQSSGIVVRYNDVREGVAGIEIENCSNAQVYGNYGTANTAGLLVFRDGSLTEDRSDCHDVHHNVFIANNEPNFGTGTVAIVPTGTGLLVVSNHTSSIAYNVMRDNNTGGLLMVDEKAVVFTPYSPIQALSDNYVFKNVMQDNGASPDFVRYPLPFGLDLLLLAVDLTGNCENGNIYGTEFGFSLFSSGTNIGTCVLPPPLFPTCPGTPISNP